MLIDNFKPWHSQTPATATNMNLRHGTVIGKHASAYTRTYTHNI